MGHTPGPWDFAGGDMTVHANRLALEICRHIGGHTEVYSNAQEEERIANAHLIAAAPELLAALKLLRNPAGDGRWPCYCEDPHYYGGKCENCIATDAIDKAEGRSA